MGRMLTAAVICAATLSLATAALADEPPPALRATLEKVVKDDGAPGVTAIAFKDGKRLYRLDVGDIAPDAEDVISSEWVPSRACMVDWASVQLTLLAPPQPEASVSTLSTL